MYGVKIKRKAMTLRRTPKDALALCTRISHDLFQVAF